MAFSTKKCKSKANSFCYICGIYAALPRLRRNISLLVKRAYKTYFQVPLGALEKNWALHVAIRPVLRRRIFIASI